MASALKAEQGRRACRKGGSAMQKLACWQAQQRQQNCAWQLLGQGSGTPATEAPHELQRHAKAARYPRAA